MKFEFSAGGVVFRKNNNQIEILLGQHSQHHGWVFPKGLIGDKIENEKKEATAIREVEEETGVFAEIIQPLEPTTFWYQFAGEKRKKTVYYFLMKYISEDATKRDLEMENIEWLPLTDVEKRLTYKSDQIVWKQAQDLLPLHFQRN